MCVCVSGCVYRNMFINYRDANKTSFLCGIKSTQFSTFSWVKKDKNEIFRRFRHLVSYSGFATKRAILLLY